MNIAAHAIPAQSEHMLHLMRVALTRARDWEPVSPLNADKWGLLAGTALEAAIDIDAGAA